MLRTAACRHHPPVGTNPRPPRLSNGTAACGRVPSSAVTFAPGRPRLRRSRPDPPRRSPGEFEQHTCWDSPVSCSAIPSKDRFAAKSVRGLPDLSRRAAGTAVGARQGPPARDAPLIRRLCVRGHQDGDGLPGRMGRTEGEEVRRAAATPWCGGAARDAAVAPLPATPRRAVAPAPVAAEGPGPAPPCRRPPGSGSRGAASRGSCGRGS